MSIQPPPLGPQASQPSHQQGQYLAPSQAFVPPPGPPGAPTKSVLPLIAIVLAGLAFLTGVIPVTSWSCWLFAIPAFVIGLIALLKGYQPKALSLVAVIVAPIAWIISIVVFVVAVMSGAGGAPERGITSVDREPSPQASAGQVEETPDVQPEPVADGTSLDSPLPAGTAVSVDSWSGQFDISFGPVNWDATVAIENENPFNPDPDDGKKYIMVPVTVTNTDSEEWSVSGTVFWADIKLVSNGRGFSEGAIVVVPDGLSDQGDLYPGGSVTGNVVFEVPADVVAGVWDIDGVFVAA
jgi:hypothetical protein